MSCTCQVPRVWIWNRCPAVKSCKQSASVWACSEQLISCTERIAVMRLASTNCHKAGQHFLEHASAQLCNILPQLRLVVLHKHRTRVARYGQYVLLGGTVRYEIRTMGGAYGG
eukprot:360861-Chlamydomonas_euryale.AAC.1